MTESGPDTMRIALALLFIGHGIAHLPGFFVPWRLATLGEMPYKTTVTGGGGAVDLGSVGIRLVGILWLLAGLGFVSQESPYSATTGL